MQAICIGQSALYDSRHVWRAESKSLIGLQKQHTATAHYTDPFSCFADPFSSTIRENNKGHDK